MTAGRKRKPDEAAFEPITYLPAVSPRYGAEHFRLFAKKFLVIPHGQGAGKPMKLAPYQLDAVRETLEGSKKVNLFIGPRGQGKSGLVAALMIFVMAYAKAQNQKNLLVAQSDARAMAALKTMRQMVSMNPELDQRFTFYKTHCVYHPNGAECEAMASTQSAIEGSICTGLAFADEGGFMDHDAYEALILSLKSDDARLFMASTPSPWRLRDKAPLFGLREAAKAGDPDISLFELMGDPDADPLDWGNIRKANPAIEAGILSEKAVRASLPPKTSLQEHLRARLALWPQDAGGEQYMPADAWKKQARPGVAIPAGAKVVLSLDGSQRWDATVLTVTSVSKTPHQVPGGYWYNVDQSDDYQVSHAEVEDRILQLSRKYRVLEVTADPSLWQRTLQVLEEQGLRVTQFPQHGSRMPKALAEYKAAVLDGKVTHSDDPNVTRHMMNAQLKESGFGLKLAKATKDQKIDFAVTCVMGYSRAYWLALKNGKRKIRSFKR